MYYGHRIRMLENKLKQSQGLPHQLFPTSARAIKALQQSDIEARLQVLEALHKARNKRKG